MIQRLNATMSWLNVSKLLNSAIPLCQNCQTENLTVLPNCVPKTVSNCFDTALELSMMLTGCNYWLALLLA